MRSFLPCLATLILLPAAAGAQTSAGRVDGGPWRPELSLDPNALPYVEGTLVPGAGNWNAGVAAEYVYRPLTAGGQDLVSHQVWTTFSLQLGLGSRVGVGLQVPVMVFQDSNLSAVGGSSRGAGAAGLGDVRAIVRWSTRPEESFRTGRGGAAPSQVTQRQTERREGFGGVLALAVTAPSGDPASLSGAGATTAHVFGVADLRLARILAAVSLGYRARLDGNWPSQSGDCPDATSTACLYDFPLRDQITWSVGLRQPLELLFLPFELANVRAAGAITDALRRVATTYVTFQGAVDARAPFADPRTSPLEMGAGLQREAGSFTLTLGAAWALTRAPGTAAARVLASVQWAPRFHDTDGDGIPDNRERPECVALAEDFDGNEDADGCPEDNDHDAVPDEEDRCPTVDEDEDGYEDEDGCPDADNDGDGVSDTDDQCPDEARGDHPDAAREGCPDTDQDHDGVANADDQCPDEAQGDHPDASRAGCPSPDRDRDGVADAEDRCPELASERDAPAEQRGCPEPDHDHDGVTDTDDRCPSEVETLNGVTDEDGCPETGVVPGARLRVRVARTTPDAPGTITLLEAVRFDARDEVLPASRPLLAQLAVALRATTRVPDRWHELSVRTTAPAVRGPLAVDAARANRRRDAVLNALRALGVTELSLRPGEPSPPSPTPDRGVVLTPRGP